MFTYCNRQSITRSLSLILSKPNVSHSLPVGIFPVERVWDIIKDYTSIIVTVYALYKNNTYCQLL